MAATDGSPSKDLALGTTRSNKMRTRISAAWIALALGAAVLILILIFIQQNPSNVQVTFLGFSVTLSLGVALLFAALAGAVVVLAVGSARILQLRRAVQKSSRIEAQQATSPTPEVKHAAPETPLTDGPAK